MKTLNVALLTLPQIRHICYSAAMANAICDTTHVINDDSTFLHFIAQNYLAMTGPVSIDAGTPHDLKHLCNLHFHQHYLPNLEQVSQLSPQVVLAWLRDVEWQKQQALAIVRSRFERVRVANEAIRENLLVSQRAMVVIERAGAIFVAAVPAYLLLTGAAAVAVGAASTIALGFAGAHLTARPLAEMHHPAAVLCFQALLHGGLAVAEQVAERGAHDWHLQEHIGEKILRALQSEAWNLARSPKFAQLFQDLIKNMDAQVAARRAVAFGRAGVVVGVGVEAYAEIREGMEDWDKEAH